MSENRICLRHIPQERVRPLPMQRDVVGVLLQDPRVAPEGDEEASYATAFVRKEQIRPEVDQNGMPLAGYVSVDLGKSDVPVDFSVKTKRGFDRFAMKNDDVAAADGVWHDFTRQREIERAEEEVVPEVSWELGF